MKKEFFELMSINFCFLYRSTADWTTQITKQIKTK